MKLLAKSDIQKAKSVDRQREIDEGLKLARRVDSLREVASQEEASLKKFRSETLTVISKEITNTIDKRDKLLCEVQTLEERKEKALVPLDKEWAEVRKEKNEVERKDDELHEWRDELDVREISLQDRLIEINEIETDTARKNREADILFRDASAKINDAEAKNKLSTDTLEKAQQQSAILLTDAEQRLESVKEQEERLAEKEQELNKKQAAQEKDWILLRDRQQTFARTLKRFNK